MCIDCLATASIFSCLDLQSGYGQLEMDERNRPKTAFITKYGLFEHTNMPFGLCNTPSTFQRCMKFIFRGIQWQTILNYLDDIIISSSDLHEHFEHLNEVLKRLKNAGLKLKSSKCDLIKDEILYLGHLVGKTGVKPNNRIIETVKNWKTPNTVKEVQQFLGLCNYYRQFIKGFGEVAAPLTHLTRKDADFQWSDSVQQCFEKFKLSMCTAPILAYPKPDGMFILDIDASNIGIGGILQQVQDGKEQVIPYVSTKLDKSQQRYSVTRRELLAMVTFIYQVKHYLLGRKCILRTDHGALKWLYNFKDTRGQLARWIKTLAQYKIEIHLSAGIKHNNADALSRVDYTTKLCTHQQNEEFDASSESFKNIVYHWKDFKLEIDNVQNLSKTDKNKKPSKDTVRVATRKQDRNTTACNWLGNYTNGEISTFQKEDPHDLILYKRLDHGHKADRDVVASLSPAVRI